MPAVDGLPDPDTKGLCPTVDVLRLYRQGNPLAVHACFLRDMGALSVRCASIVTASSCSLTMSFYLKWRSWPWRTDVVGLSLCVQTNRAVEDRDLDAWVTIFAALFTKPALQLSSVSHRLLFPRLVSLNEDAYQLQRLACTRFPWQVEYVRSYIARVSLLHRLVRASHLRTTDALLNALSASNNDFARVRGSLLMNTT